MEAALERAEAAAELAAAAWSDGATAVPERDMGPSFATVIQPELPGYRLEACAPPPVGPEVEFETPEATLDEPPDERSRAYERLAEQVVSKVSAGGRAALMFISARDGQATACLLRELTPPLTRRMGAEFSLFDGSMERPNLAGRLDQLRRQYRLVLVDAGSLCRPEAARLGCYCDGTYLVLRPHETPARTLREVVRAIRASGGRFLGTVVMDGADYSCGRAVRRTLA